MSHKDIAIVGMGCRMPGEANGINNFWKLLMNHDDAIIPYPEDRPTLTNESMTIVGGFLKDIARFDHQFFSISAKEAEYMDPQQRILLEVAWEALESAGIPKSNLAGTKTGVFIGISQNEYPHFFPDDDNEIYYATGNSLSIAANRLSYIFNLQGPSMAIDTACSSSLVATHYACESIRSGESDIALAGGVNLILTDRLNAVFQKAGMLSKDGKCKTFDASADGYVRGEGCGVVILKRLSEALKDNDKIYCIIKGSAVNQDGYSNGLTAPNPVAQEKVIHDALDMATVLPEEVTYVETHGTGTLLGDPIELNTLSKVFAHDGDRDSLYIGALKTYIGHLESAAGIAGLMKASLSMHHKIIPANLNLKEINPYLEPNPWMVFPKQSQVWDQKVRYAGVSSFGFGGTNAHVILSNDHESA